jgi:CDP-2,3-bis-(O-geranylgeranyl)-sn-glycerol synthase
MQLQLVLKLVLLLAIANGAPILANKLLGAALAYPLDGGRSFIDGRPILGPSKTIRGLTVAVTATSVCAPLLDVEWTTGLIIGLAAMAGDLASSFIKRRIGYPSSGRALALDQIPEALLPAVAAMNLMALTIVDVIVVVALFSLGELALSRLLFRLRIRNRPY